MGLFKKGFKKLKRGLSKVKKKAKKFAKKHKLRDKFKKLNPIALTAKLTKKVTKGTFKAVKAVGKKVSSLRKRKTKYNEPVSAVENAVMEKDLNMPDGFGDVVYGDNEEVIQDESVSSSGIMEKLGKNKILMIAAGVLGLILVLTLKKK